MTILTPGTFNVSDYRKDIPDRVVREVLKRYRRDHRPPLGVRPFDTDANDFIPPQLDPEYIDLIEIAVHDHRTFGRKPGAAKTVTTRGSDVGEMARTRSIAANHAIHQAVQANKRGDYSGAAKILSSVKKKDKPKKKWGSRPFPKGRGFQKREERARQ